MLLLFRFKEEKMLLQLLLKEAPLKHETFTWRQNNSG